MSKKGKRTGNLGERVLKILRTKEQERARRRAEAEAKRARDKK